MELFEEIRREYEFGVGTIQGVARQLGVHRRLVREALSSAVPVEKPAPKRKRPRLGPVVDFIDAILEEDRRAPRKQRHTAIESMSATSPGLVSAMRTVVWPRRSQFRRPTKRRSEV